MTLLYPPFAWQIADFEKAMEDAGYKVFTTEAYRSLKRQENLYGSGRLYSGPILTKALPGLSMHHYGLAKDYAFCGDIPYPPTQDPVWDTLELLAEKQGLVSGRDFKAVDSPHVEYKSPLKAKELFDLYKKGGIILVWKTLDEKMGLDTSKLWSPYTEEVEHVLRT